MVTVTAILLCALTSESARSVDLTCGQLALLVACRSLRSEVVTADVLRCVPPHPSMTHTLLELKNGANQLGFKTRAIRLGNYTQPTTLTGIVPVVTSKGTRHFVAVVGAREEELLVYDYPAPPAWVSMRALREKNGWGGEIVILSREDGLPSSSVGVNQSISAVLSIAVGTTLCVFVLMGIARGERFAR